MTNQQQIVFLLDIIRNLRVIQEDIEMDLPVHGIKRRENLVFIGTDAERLHFAGKHMTHEERIESGLWNTQIGDAYCMDYLKDYIEHLKEQISELRGDRNE